MCSELSLYGFLAEIAAVSFYEYLTQVLNLGSLSTDSISVCVFVRTHASAHVNTYVHVPVSLSIEAKGYWISSITLYLIPLGQELTVLGARLADQQISVVLLSPACLPLSALGFRA